MRAHQIARAKKATVDVREMIDDLCKDLHDDMDAFPEGSNIRRCLTKAIDNLDNGRTWLESVLKEARREEAILVDDQYEAALKEHEAMFAPLEDGDDQEMPNCPTCGHDYDVKHVIHDEFYCERCETQFQKGDE